MENDEILIFTHLITQLDTLALKNSILYKMTFIGFKSGFKNNNFAGIIMEL